MIRVVEKPTQPDRDAVRRLLAAMGPDLRLVRATPLDGGVSAQVTVIEAARPDGAPDKLVLRQYGPANLRTDPHSAAHEYRLLTLLHAAGLPVPRPRHADESGAILPGPFLVSDFIDGDPGNAPAFLAEPPPAFISQLAATLADLHQAGIPLADAPFLTAITDTAIRKMGTCPAQPDVALNEAAVRAAMARAWPPPVVNDPVVLHGDYWPGNTLWRDGTLTGVIDWEDAQAGDPVADLANARMELCMFFRLPTAESFTREYRALMPGLDLSSLPHWELHAALRHAGRMGGWGLSAEELARLQAGHREFTSRALAQF